MLQSIVLALSVVLLTAFAFGADDKQGKHDPAPPANADVPKLSVEEFDKKRKEKDAVVLDVRTPEEFKEGHVPGAVNLDISDKDFDKKVDALDKGKTYLVHCARGGRSSRATEVMRPKFDKLYDFSGGMNAWQKAGKPVEK
jgi:rhodanese-related sulfurtransferase